MPSTDMYLLVVRDIFNGPEYRTINANCAPLFSPDKVSTNPSDPWYGYVILDGVARTSVENDVFLSSLRKMYPPKSRDCNLPPVVMKEWKSVSVPHLFCSRRDPKCDGTCE